jgi:hypothetical protein
MKNKRLTAAELVKTLPNLAGLQAELARVEEERTRINAEYQRLTRLTDELRSVDEVCDGVPLNVQASESYTSFSPLGDDLEYTRRADVKGIGEDYPPIKWLLLLDGNWGSTKWKEYDDRAEAEAAAKRYAVYGIVPCAPQQRLTEED